MKPPLKSVAVLLGFAIGAVFIYLSISALDWASVSATFAKAELSWAIVALFFLGLAYALRLERWRLMLVAIGSKSSRKSLMAPFLGSFALNNVLPLRLGDAARATAFQKQLDVNVSGGVATLLIERVYDLYALLLIGFVSFLSLNMTQTSLPAFNYGPILAGLFLVLVSLTAMLVFPRAFAALGLWFRRGPLGKVLPKVLFNFGIRTLLHIARIGRSASKLQLMGLSVLAWILEGFVIYFAAKALNVVVQTGASWLSLVTANLGTLIPGTPGHFGTFHYIGAQTLSISPAPITETILVITLAHFLIWAGVTIAGFSALLFHSRTGTLFASRRASPASK